MLRMSWRYAPWSTRLVGFQQPDLGLAPIHVLEIAGREVEALGLALSDLKTLELATSFAAFILRPIARDR